MALMGNWGAYDNWLRNAQRIWANEEQRGNEPQQAGQQPKIRRAAHHGSGGRKSRGRDNWIKDLRKVRGDKYDYSLLPDPVYVDMTVTIICPEHGEFQQSLRAHYYTGAECPKCRLAQGRINGYIARTLKRADGGGNKEQ